MSQSPSMAFPGSCRSTQHLHGNRRGGGEEDICPREVPQEESPSAFRASVPPHPSGLPWQPERWPPGLPMILKSSSCPIYRSGVTMQNTKLSEEWIGDPDARCVNAICQISFFVIFVLLDWTNTTQQNSSSGCRCVQKRTPSLQS